MISLRAVEPEDLTLLYLWENDRSVWKVSNTFAPFSKFRLQRYIEESGDIREHGQLRMMIDSHNDGHTKTVGAVDLFDFDPVHQRAGIGILIASGEDRGQGFASEAIRLMINYSKNILFLHQIYCNIAASNIVSVKLFGKAGFKLTGNKRNWLKTAAGWEDELLLQLIL
ncbi:MAG: GNAT family N-acetyltransferase [Bacteroidales bacterium]|jgi:diamine N-acetyltransferase|nr:GNAT family N-acetyltransferase [Bacteroidales bacterium]